MKATRLVEPSKGDSVASSSSSTGKEIIFCEDQFRPREREARKQSAIVVVVVAAAVNEFMCSTHIYSQTKIYLHTSAFPFWSPPSNQTRRSFAASFQQRGRRWRRRGGQAEN